PALPIRRYETILPATLTSTLLASSSAVVALAYLPESSAAVAVERNSCGYAEWPCWRNCSSFRCLCSNWSCGSNCTYGILNSFETNGEYNGPRDGPATKPVSSYMLSGIVSRFWSKTMNARVPVRRYDSVQQDWRSLLPEAKSYFFHTHANELENAYLILSVPLDEAIDFRQRGRIVQASQAAEVTAGLCDLL